MGIKDHPMACQTTPISLALSWPLPICHLLRVAIAIYFHHGVMCSSHIRLMEPLGWSIQGICNIYTVNSSRLDSSFNKIHLYRRWLTKLFCFGKFIIKILFHGSAAISRLVTKYLDDEDQHVRRSALEAAVRLSLPPPPHEDMTAEDSESKNGWILHGFSLIIM